MTDITDKTVNSNVEKSKTFLVCLPKFLFFSSLTSVAVLSQLNVVYFAWSPSLQKCNPHVVPL